VPGLDVDVRWRREAPDDERLRARIVRELHEVAWSLSQLQLLLHDAHQATGAQHAFLLPRMEARLPLFDLGRRYRVVLSHVNEPRLALVDEEGKCIADVKVV
jgi:hypothetical protein